MADFQYYGTVSHGTMRNVDLLETFGTLLAALTSDLPSDHAHLGLVAESVTMHGRLVDAESSGAYVDHAYATDVVMSLFDALDEYAPDGYYFGAIEGDGSDYGYWPLEEDA